MTLVLNGTTGVSSVDGSAATPAIQGADTNTGVFFPAADTVAIATGGTERLRADSSGNVGIGTSSPVTKLNIGGTSDQSIQINGSGTAAYVGTSTSVAQISSNRNPTTGAIYDANRAVSYINLEASNGNGNIQFYTTATNNVNATERARIDSSGNLLVGTTSTDSGRMCVEAQTNGFAISFRRNTGVYGSNTKVGQISCDGSSTAYTTSSDYRLKENIQPMTGALATVAQLNPVTYSWKFNGSASQGFIAHELQAVLPDAVVGEKDAVDADGNPQYQGIDTSFLVATLTAAIQEQQAMIVALKAEVDALKGAQA